MACESECFNTANCAIWHGKPCAACTCLCDVSLRLPAADATRPPAPRCHQKQGVYFLRTSRVLGLDSHRKEGKCCLIPQLGTQVNFLWSPPPLHNPGQHKKQPHLLFWSGRCAGHSSKSSGPELGSADLRLYSAIWGFKGLSLVLMPVGMEPSTKGPTYLSSSKSQRL